MIPYREKRKYKRVKKQIATILLLEEGVYLEISSISVDISQGGIKLTSPRALSPGTLLSISFAIPGEKKKKISCKGSVLRCDENDNRFEIAVQFSCVSDDQKEKLGSIVDKFSGDPA